MLLSRDILCLAVKSAPSSGAPETPYTGLFDVSDVVHQLVLLRKLIINIQFADVNAFLTFAATRHTYSPEHLIENPRVTQIMEAAKAGRVPVNLVSSELFLFVQAGYL